MSKPVPHWQRCWPESHCGRHLNSRLPPSTAPPCCCSTWSAGRPERDTWWPPTGSALRTPTWDLIETTSSSRERVRRWVEIRSKVSSMCLECSLWIVIRFLFKTSYWFYLAANTWELMDQRSFYIDYLLNSVDRNSLNSLKETVCHISVTTHTFN